MTPPIELALGTVQFGLAYGIAGRSAPVPEAEVRTILERAAALGIRRLDTAAAYGDIEERLDRLTSGLDFDIVSKIPAVPPTLDDEGALDFVAASFERSRERLGNRLRGMLFHSGADLAGARGERLWACADAVGAERGIAIGASLYDPADLAELRRRFAVRMAQVPGSALDQRLAVVPATAEVEITLRSLFLQGLLLMPGDAARRRLPVATAALDRWDAWREALGLSRLAAALSVAKTLPGVRYCVVGVDSLGQLDEIAAAWGDADPLCAAELHSGDLNVIDPRKWPATS